MLVESQRGQGSCSCSGGGAPMLRALVKRLFESPESDGIFGPKKLSGFRKLIVSILSSSKSSLFFAGIGFRKFVFFFACSGKRRVKGGVLWGEKIRRIRGGRESIGTLKMF